MATKNSIEELLTDKEGHIDVLDPPLDLEAKHGEEKYALLTVFKMDEAE